MNYKLILLLSTGVQFSTCYLHQRPFQFKTKSESVVDISDYDLRILHTNDVHSHYTETNIYNTDCTPTQQKLGQCFGSFARYKTVVDKLRKGNNKTLLLDGGDQFQGTMFYNYYRGNATVDIMNKMEYDVMSLGNHEFDDGVLNLLTKVKQFNFPVISANVLGSGDFNQVIKPYVQFPQHDLAIIGFITANAGKLSKFGDSLQFFEPIQTVQQIIDDLKGLNVTRIIGLSHNGYLEDLELAKSTTGLSLIVGGHSHTYLPPDLSLEDSNLHAEEYGVYPTKVLNLQNKPVYVVQAYCYGKYLGHIDLKFAKDGYISSILGKPIEIKLQQKDEEFERLLVKLKGPYLEYSNKVIGYATEPFTTNQCQYLECTMGNFLTDAMYSYNARTNNFTTTATNAKGNSADGEDGSVDFAIINSGGIRAGLPQGKVRNLDILTILPFDNKLTHVKLKGADIFNLVQSSILRFNNRNQLKVTSFIQVSGLRFNYRESELIKLEILDRKTNKFVKVVDNKVYKMATCDFLANGGDNLLYPMPTTDNVAQFLDLADLTKLYTTKLSPLVPRLEGRILN